MKIEIKTVLGSLLFEYDVENNSLRNTLEQAVKKGAYLEGAYLKGAYLKGADLKGAYLKGADLKGAYLEGADLKGAYLKGADLKGAYLEGAYLEGADLKGAYLEGADLKGAYLKGADLEGAYLEGADLKGADLKGAYLEGADLKGADLKGADLEGADLKGADLSPIKNDLFALLLYAKSEIENLKKALIEGRVDGSTYEGECACLCGTIEKTAPETIRKKVHDLRDSSRLIERFFLGIKKGDIPETNQVSKIVMEWIEEFEQLIK